MAWMTPFEAFTSGITTRAVPSRTILPPLKESAIDSPCTVLIFSPFLATSDRGGGGD